MQGALTQHQSVISVEVSLPDQAVIKVRKNTATPADLANIVKASGFTATAK
ncbi:hypothetical protein F4Z99_19530 [Candidatus Poribacteria bacterium]|nr:hypothetical protein [Candidatus Poribacteria bacterium]MYB00708.1 hypothetical protein [Candidatus Poribacteria bacterium]